MSKKGTIGGIYPPKNTGARHGAGSITEDGTGYKFIFHTPEDIDQSMVPISVGMAVQFDTTNGHDATGVVAPITVPQISCTLTASSATTLSWTSSGADKLILNPNNIPLSPVGGGTISVPPGTYTITASNSSGASVTSDPVTVTG